MNYYRVLGISKDATEEEIRSSYRRLVREHHPDVTHSNSAEFRRIQEAYDAILSAKRSEKESGSESVKVEVTVFSRSAGQSSRVHEVSQHRVREVDPRQTVGRGWPEIDQLLQWIWQ